MIILVRKVWATVIADNYIRKRLVGKDGASHLQSNDARGWHCMGKIRLPCFLGVDNNSKECFNSKDTCAVLRTLTIKILRFFIGPQ